ncbi:DUF4097 family beta strand repeat-containing protein [Microbacterium sp. cf332]|uniref:DUF4097 family beta strand repeat-containing protein n=1 Tax=Microbacterium sp. cf332 TaxID=1761804 RepID=UPI00087F4C3E|nr:DUF4097 family beta strand repeat-containing protein [Microbacterium sp. cf332]SDQ61902.1 Putative adhesin [Microbacterium sp. cf332]
MTLQKWIVHPGESRVIDIDDIRKLKVGMVGGQIDIVAHDEPGVRIEVHAVTGKDLRIEATGEGVEIDHPQLRWDNFVQVFRNFGSAGPQAEISVAVPRGTDLTLGVVSASALVTGLEADARVNTVSGDIIIDGITGDVSANAVSGDVQIRELAGALTAKSVSGDVAAIGTLRAADIDTVSGAMLVDSSGPIQSVTLHTVGGDATVRLDDGLPANYQVRSVSGRVLIDGAVRSGQGAGPLTNFTGSTGELSGSFVDVRTNSVAGDLTVLRRPAPAVPAIPDAAAPAVSAAAPELDASQAETPEQLAHPAGDDTQHDLER